MCNHPPSPARQAEDRNFVTRREERERKKKKGWIFLRQYLELRIDDDELPTINPGGQRRGTVDRNSIPNVDPPSSPPPSSSLEMKQPRKGGGERGRLGSDLVSYFVLFKCQQCH